ncbi:Swt1 family HEPN domain-containing protein [Jongsikchunia kroppenstedtii]|uniref:Swt1 family HEPN domain-containing protein n=1 Tax=Jongsikchunia kroppenstedtii TaxID=1121721 RepID=UPI0003606368|nr:Swt1 family HEPN domain-containing protein [Jongsikchunia kroppenstedtii]
MAQTNRDRVGKAMELLGPALDVFLTKVFDGELPGQTDWTALLAAKDSQQGGGAPKSYSRTDPQNSLRMLANNVPGSLRRGWYPFDEHLSRVEKSWAEELRDARNKWAHNEPFSFDDCTRALDTTERFLKAINAPEAADQVRRSRIDLMRLGTEREDSKVVKSTATADIKSPGLQPWRTILTPHKDVASGNFHAAQFAADLGMVARGESDAEYNDPIEFFRRTFLTEGLKDLIRRAVARLSGDMNASPVINLQTNFGGGKTHSMLAVWHLASGRSLTEFPQEVQDTLGVSALPTNVKRVALVGTEIQAGAPKTVAPGVTVNTIWGILAWQLGGAEAYEIVRAADEAGTSPGESLRVLFETFGPAAILIDEWVAYARMLLGTENLPDGTFDSQFTFAQTLTEQTKAVPGMLLLVSIPASEKIEDGKYVGDEEEVGGENGKAALNMLRKAVSRVADQWRPANADESFEIVRRRLFEEPTADQRAQITNAAKELSGFYQKYHAEFPKEAVDSDYQDKIKRSYPIHPELFERLYQDWSTLERFQRTRGVLRLMNVIVGSLWRSEASAPFVMPGDIPLDDKEVSQELNQYLDDNWIPIIDRDVDGRDAVPAKIDKENTALGARHITQRLARTVFIGAVPGLKLPKSTHKGLDRKRVFLGTAIPGDVPGNFYPALNHLTNQATYFYGADNRYWYDTHANTTRSARDYAEQLHAEDVWAEVKRRLNNHRKPSPTGFVNVHIAPDSTAEVPDIAEVRLVMLPANIPHAKGKADSTATEFAREYIDNAGSAQRINRNMIAFLAPDESRSRELDSGIREYLAWKHLADNAKQYDFTASQLEQINGRVTTHDQTVKDRLAQTYTWLITPTALPGQKYTLDIAKADTNENDFSARAAAKMRDDSILALNHSPRNIRLQLDGPLKSIWAERGYISLGELWGYYAQHPYMPRLRDRSVLEAGVLGVFDDPIGWEAATFALAIGVDDGKFTEVFLPSGNLTPPVSDSLLLIRPDLAQKHVDEQISEITEAPESMDGASPDEPVQPPPVGPAPKTRYVGTKLFAPDAIASQFSNVLQEVIQQLQSVDGAQVEVRIDIAATAPNGFDEAKMRTVKENGTTLKFQDNEFYAD